MTTGTAGDAYAELIKEQLEEQRRRKESLEQRGVFVVTSSGVLATVLFGLSGLVADREGFSLSACAVGFISAAVVLFVLAAVAGLLINFPLGYKEAKTDELRRLTGDQPLYWRGEEALGSRRAAELRVDVIESARAANGRKAVFLEIGLGLEVTAAFCVAVAAIIIL